MRKIFTVLVAVFAIIFGTQGLFAASGDYKNNLLKIEITKLDENSYDIGLYTQKVYNEPVKIIKKTDTVYYFLLPETSNSITSVTPNDAIKNVLIKSYPYAGQDMENSYTKVAIITSKPVNLSTSLRTLDTSISPRLDPIRLAKLDKVFERYSDRLAENNIPTPLAEFRKQTVAAKRPELQSNVKVKEEKVASAKVPATKPVQKAKPAQTVVKKQPVKQTVQTAVKKPVYVAQKPKTQTYTKKQPAQTVQKRPLQTVKQPVQTAVKKPVYVAQKPKTTVQVQKQQTKPVAITTKPVKQTKQQPKIAYNKELTPMPVSVEPVEIKTKQPINNEAVEIVKKQAENQKQVEEFEKQLATTEPVDAEFGKKVPVEVAQNKKNIEAELVEPIENAPAENLPTKTQGNNTMGFVWLFAVLLILYILAKKNTISKKRALEATNKQNAAKGADDIKEFLKKRTAIKKQAEEPIQEIEHEETQLQPEIQPQEEPVKIEYVQQEQKEPAMADNKQDEDERIQAFNAYMENIQEDSNTMEEETTLQSLSDITEDDAVIAQLYTPIENISGGFASYAEENEIQPITADEQEPVQIEPVQDEDVATIVSTSKLTETRGLYLAKFEGATSLVGYIQDDINVQDTKIESSLAQENDTDSIYIVKTGGKKLMVKSTPYDMSLEMVM